MFNMHYKYEHVLERIYDIILPTLIQTSMLRVYAQVLKPVITWTVWQLPDSPR